MIALYDRDYVCNPVRQLFNIQLMKLASYYKRKNELVSLINDLSRAQYYTKVYYRQNNPNLDFPEEIYKYSNIDIGGYAINPKYKPMAPEIEEQIPDTEIYNQPWCRKDLIFKSDKTFYRRQLSAIHLLLSTNGKDIDIKAYPQNKNRSNACIYIHDQNIDNFNIKEILSKVYPINDHNISINFIDNLYIHKYSTLQGLQHIRINTPLYVDTPITQSQFRELVKVTSKGSMKNMLFIFPDQTTEVGKSKQLYDILKAAILFTAFKRPYNFITGTQFNKNQFYVYEALYNWTRICQKRDKYFGKTAWNSFYEYANDKMNLVYALPLISMGKDFVRLSKVDLKSIYDNGGIFLL